MMKKSKLKGIHRGVSSYCFDHQLYHDMELEDIFMHMQDMGAYGLEILADGVVKGYPNPTNDWLDKWFGMVERYDIVPVEYGHWVESRMFRDRDYSTEEAVNMLVHDIKLASYMGFSCMRTKLGVSDEILTPVANWKDIIRRALPTAEKYDVVMLPEIHMPTKLKSQMIEDYCEFIDKEQTKHFGFNIDFGVFSLDTGHVNIPGVDFSPSKPEDIVPLLPYVHCCHAKFNNMDENFEETTIPYKEVVELMKANGWNGYLLSEYEGGKKDDAEHVITQLRRHHVLLKGLLGE